MASDLPPPTNGSFYGDNTDVDYGANTTAPLNTSPMNSSFYSYSLPTVTPPVSQWPQWYLYV